MFVDQNMHGRRRESAIQPGRCQQEICDVLILHMRTNNYSDTKRWTTTSNDDFARVLAMTLGRAKHLQLYVQTLIKLT